VHRNGAKIIVRLIFTDLDGSLLDHNTYSFAPAAELLLELEQQQIPVIPVTSKTRAEVMALRQTLNNKHPFIIENGAAICIPKQYFPNCPEGAVVMDNQWLICNSQPRSQWLGLLDTVSHEFAGQYQTFSSICTDQGVAALAKLTGLTVEQAALAQQREYSEPIHWLGSASRKAEFIDRLSSVGGHLLQGGRFLTLGGKTNKGLALLQLQAIYTANSNQPHQSIAIGDSDNDISMLEAADAALVIASANHPAPEVNLREHLFVSTATGPHGWVEGVTAWLADD
jgi:mannosyl-3-phosphoglycerate phosphatase family protein